MKKTEVASLVFRYGILLLIGLMQLSVLYSIFTPLTYFPVVEILRLIFPGVKVNLADASFQIADKVIVLVPACIAGAAYYLLLMLNLALPMPLRKRLKNIAFLWSSFLILNILRIVLFSYLFLQGSPFFDTAHLWTWQVGSTLLVVALWFASAKLFRIDTIPFYADLLILLRESGLNKSTSIHAVNKIRKNKL